MMDPRAENFSKYLDWVSASWNLFEQNPKAKKKPPTAPGDALKLKLTEVGLSQSEIARKLKCSHAKVNEVINGKRAITAKFALDLERVLDFPANYWLSLQVEFDLWRLRR